MSCLGHVREILSSIQGEGMLVGRRQIFVRFLGCNLRCSFCDTPESQKMRGECRVQEAPNILTFRVVENPITPERALALIDSLDLSLHHSVSMTGGEPLLQSDYVGDLAERLRRKKVTVYLETNGTLPDRLPHCLRAVDVIGMDWKLASSTGQQDWSEEHIRFLREGAAKILCVKLVITESTDQDEFEDACGRIAEAGSQIPVIIQPATRTRRARPPSPERLLQFHSLAHNRVEDVRVIPQTHRQMGLQ